MDYAGILMVGGNRMNEIKIPCSVCGKETETAKGWHLRHNINFCSEKCIYDFIEEFMVMTFEATKNNEKKLKMLENRISTIMKTRKKKK
jgi:hypothetical protein